MIIKGLPDGLLYHYTDFRAFKSIVDSSSLWLSHYLNLSDNKEIKLGFNVVREAATQKFGQIQDRILRLMLLDCVDRHLPKDYYISCFCPFRDNAYLWREYGDNYRGIAIGFDVKYFAHFLQKPEYLRPVYLFPVNYDINAFEAQINDTMAQVKIPALNVMRGITVREDLWKTPHYLETRDTMSRMLAEATMLKNTNYSDEKEWRLVNSPDFKHLDLPKINGKNVAVFEFPKDIIKEVVVSNRNANMISKIEAVINDANLSRVSITTLEV
ncbi:MAG: DUF2971 domain-containing protein [Rickettsiales bacterium]